MGPAARRLGLLLLEAEEETGIVRAGRRRVAARCVPYTTMHKAGL